MNSIAVIMLYYGNIIPDKLKTICFLKCNIDVDTYISIYIYKMALYRIKLFNSISSIEGN